MFISYIYNRDGIVELDRSSIRGLDKEPKVLLLVILLLTQGLILYPQKSIDVYSLILVHLNAFRNLRHPLLRLAWPSNIFGELRRNML